MSDKKRLYMTTPQSPGSKNPNQKEKEKIYQNFRKRVMKISKHAYVDKGEKPVLLRLHLEGSLFDSVIEVLVKFGSFQPVYSQTDTQNKIEIGFECEARTIFDAKYRLVVLRKQFKAYMEVLWCKSLFRNSKKGFFLIIFQKFI